MGQKVSYFALHTRYFMFQVKDIVPLSGVYSFKYASTMRAQQLTNTKKLKQNIRGVVCKGKCRRSKTKPE